ncbi:hypothetical protein DPEC_G00102940 [Dallia pectoralis]|uniref:Uncharacterized protein n=1 Tax=Dallia pectoralis TaxID=75939 RepID=A0ACC2GX35_DALPE|nr:hypothetical protein DPEC_G00102940 [Dallia pectoralis]
MFLVFSYNSQQSPKSGFNDRQRRGFLLSFCGNRSEQLFRGVLQSPPALGCAGSSLRCISGSLLSSDDDAFHFGPLSMCGAKQTASRMTQARKQLCHTSWATDETDMAQRELPGSSLVQQTTQSASLLGTGHTLLPGHHGRRKAPVPGTRQGSKRCKSASRSPCRYIH